MDGVHIAASPWLVTATPTLFEREARVTGWSMVEDGSEQELSIVVRPQAGK